MATIQCRNKSYRILFVHHGKRHTFTLGKIPPEIAEAKAAKVDEILALVKKGYLRIPPGADLVTFLENEGKLPEENLSTEESVNLGQLREKYIATHSGGSLEKTTLDGIKLHFKHLVATLGEKFPMRELSLAHLQQHADRRSKMKGAKGKVRSATIRKELVTLRTAWNWGVQMGLVTGRFPALRSVKMKKPDEKPPYQTREEIERRIVAGGLAEKETAELWEGLYLTLPELQDLLTHVSQVAVQSFIYPMFCLAAFTGARRSELLRAEVGDVDLKGKTIMIRERKRAHDRKTTRRVPLTPFLINVLKDWLKKHPGGAGLFCQVGKVTHSKKKRTSPTSITRNEAQDHFRRSLAGSKWQVLRGWHTLRHTFISLCASQGVDQRLIDEWVGHQTEEQRRRYRHLLPSTQQKAIQSVFG